MIKFIKNFVKAEKSDWLDHYIDLIWSNAKVANLSDIWKIAKDELLILRQLWLLDFWTKYEAYRELSPQQIFEAWQQSILQELENIHQATKQFQSETSMKK